ncbi:hypothetical protein WJX81_008298 [Elliptochloris bilobata]|uniref:Uncharacterized protein n=1 Tax=Elliptochloris bilobata TaxID=381761 RepID=A0AAW1SDA1_9CHLO
MQQGAFRDNVLSEILPLRIVNKVAQIQWQVLFFPYNVFVYCLSCLAALLLRFLVVAGAPPSEYANKAKLREVMSVVEHMHQREDAYRRKIKELQEEAEIRHRDKRKALVKLQKARVAMEAMQAQVARGGGGGGVSGRAPSRLAMHASLLLTTLCALWFFKHESVSSISRKIVSSVMFPVWLAWAWSLSSRAPPSLGIGLYCCAWFVLGFVSCSWVSGQHLGEGL